MNGWYQTFRKGTDLNRADLLRLSFVLVRVTWVGRNARGEVLDAYETLARLEQVLDEEMRVVPVVATPALGLEAKIEIEAVNVGGYPA